MTQVKVAILGCGGMAGVHARRFKANPDVRIVALCDVRQDICQAFLVKQLPDYPHPPAIFTDPAAMYAHARPDAVAIVTPHTLHFRHGMQALDAGCHVLMEKPMVTAAADAYALKARVEQTGKIFVIGYNTPCSPELHYIRQQVRDQTLGKLQLVSGFLFQSWQAPTANTWRQNPDLSGGGQAYDSGAHLLNSLCWTVESNVAQVFAFVDNNGAAVDINSTLNIRFDSGVRAAIVIGGNCPGFGAGMVYGFDKGKIEFDPWFASYIRVFEGEKQIQNFTLPGKSMSPNDNFIDAILGRDQPRTSPINGVIQSELMDAIYESARTGNPATRRPAHNA